MHLEEQLQEAKSGQGKQICLVSSSYSFHKYNSHLLGLIYQEINYTLRGLFVCSGEENVHKIQPMSSTFTKLTDFLKLLSKDFIPYK